MREASERKTSCRERISHHCWRMTNLDSFFSGHDLETREIDCISWFVSLGSLSTKIETMTGREDTWSPVCPPSSPGKVGQIIWCTRIEWISGSTEEDGETSRKCLSVSVNLHERVSSPNQCTIMPLFVSLLFPIKCKRTCVQHDKKLFFSSVYTDVISFLLHHWTKGSFFNDLQIWLSIDSMHLRRLQDSWMTRILLSQETTKLKTTLRWRTFSETLLWCSLSSSKRSCVRIFNVYIKNQYTCCSNTSTLEININYESLRKPRYKYTSYVQKSGFSNTKNKKKGMLTMFCLMLHFNGFLRIKWQ